MKIRLLIIITVFTLVLIPITTSSFAEKLFNGYSSVDPPLSEIVADQSTVMTIRFLYTSGPYVLNNFAPIIEVNPSSAEKFVQVDVDSIEIKQGQIKRIPVTITVDPHIEHEKIFLSISYVGNHFQSDELQKSSWNDQIEIDVRNRLVPEPESIFESKQDMQIFTDCGKGTTYQDGVCIVDKIENSTETSPNPSNCWGGPACNYDVESPLKQSKSGIPLEEIECKENLILIQRQDGSPACVTPETRETLIERGWTKDSNSMLQKVLDLCGCQESGGPCINPIFKWQNETHHIDSLNCKWSAMNAQENAIALDLTAHPGFDKNNLLEQKQLQGILDHCERQELGLPVNYPYLQYENETHIITNESCEWRKMHLRGNTGN